LRHASGQTYTDRHTETLIAILSTFTGGKVIIAGKCAVKVKRQPEENVAK